MLGPKKIVLCDGEMRAFKHSHLHEGTEQVMHMHTEMHAQKRPGIIFSFYLYLPHTAIRLVSVERIHQHRANLSKLRKSLKRKEIFVKILIRHELKEE